MSSPTVQVPSSIVGAAALVGGGGAAGVVATGVVAAGGVATGVVAAGVFAAGVVVPLSGATITGCFAAVGDVGNVVAAATITPTSSRRPSTDSPTINPTLDFFLGGGRKPPG